MFNTKAIIEFEIPTPDGVKLAKLRWPTDAEWSARSQKRKIIQKNMGRGSTQIEQQDYSVIDLELFNAVKTADSVELDAYEAQMLLERISYAEVIDLERQGNQYVITLATASGDTKHTLRVPSAREIMDHRRGFARVVDLPYGRQQIVINLPIAGETYDKLKVSVDEYTDAVPVIHKSAVVRAALDAVESATGDEGRVNFR